ncbi:hypothetical protein FWJ33_19110 [Leptospira interrogans serovar Hardjo]|nr:hypothetical protein B0191_03665 [Leptospira interrogans serovar Hardjo]QEI01275.1 hypothetical protein FWJ33_19110 [Leptospira interrogans serovar Hardjo]
MAITQERIIKGENMVSKFTLSNLKTHQLLTIKFKKNNYPIKFLHQITVLRLSYRKHLRVGILSKDKIELLKNKFSICFRCIEMDNLKQFCKSPL